MRARIEETGFEASMPAEANVRSSVFESAARIGFRKSGAEEPNNQGSEFISFDCLPGLVKEVATLVLTK
jgi:hypothetical protein